VIRNILFDFDGVILDSMPVRDSGFEEIFSDFDDKLVEQLLDYHNKNGGLSRYVKIEYFYNEILGKKISEKDIQNYAKNFSEIMKKKLTNRGYLIPETLDFIKNNFKKYNLHVVSGSDDKELRFLCKELDISTYFKSIHGSPVHKNKLVERVLSNNSYVKDETVLIGDSVNDCEAADVNGIDFYGFNNSNLISISKKYIKDYEDVL